MAFGNLAVEIPPPAVGNVPNWKLLASHEDTDETTAFDFDTGEMEVHEIYKLIAHIQPATTKSTRGRVRVNNDDSPNYDFNSFNASFSTGQSTGYPGWAPIGAGKGGEPWVAIAHIRGGNPAAPYVTAHPTISVSSAMVHDFYQLFNGELNVEHPEVNRIRYWTGRAATGRIRIYGLNL